MRKIRTTSAWVGCVLLLSAISSCAASPPEAANGDTLVATHTTPTSTPADVTSTSGPDSSSPPDTTKPATSESVAPGTEGPVGPTSDNPLIRLLEPAADLEGAAPVGWDPSHGGPYEFYVYDRGGTLVSMVATYADADSVALPLIYTEGQETPTPRAVSLGDWSLLVFGPNTRNTSAVQIQDVCASYDLWAFWSEQDTDTLAGDLVAVADAADCSDT
jgi:hypothetical protein